MTREELARLVASMRAKQSEYFRDRNPSLLNVCRDLERRVDRAIDEILNPPQPGLFETSDR